MTSVRLPVAAHQVGDLLEDLGCGRVSGAAGCSAALTGALAARLVAMAARARVPGEWPDAAGAVAQADLLAERLLAFADRDRDAHFAAARLLGEAGHEAADSEDGRRDRDRELASALRQAAVVPLAVAHAALDVATLATWVAQAATDQVSADAEAAVTLSVGAARAAAGLVLVNLAVATGDPIADTARGVLSAAARLQVHGRESD